MEQSQYEHNTVKDMVQRDEKKILVLPRLSLPVCSHETASLPLPASPKLDDTLPLPIIFPPDSLPHPLKLPSRQLSAVKGPVPASPTPLQSSSQAEERVHKESQSSSRAHRPRWRRVPELRQMSAVECGACCLAMILNYHGHATSVSEVQERCGVGRDGLSARAIAKAARQYGLRVRAVSVKKNDARFITFPAIAHWEFNHFVVIERWTSRYVDIVDPAVGHRRLSPAEFEEGFTGVLLMLDAGTQFKRQIRSRSLS